MVSREFRLPDPGEGLVEADIVTWRVAVGEVVKINDIIVEIETSKSIVELPSPYAGTVTALLVNEGDTVDVGSPIISIDDGVAAPAPAPAAPAPAVAHEDLVPALPDAEEAIEAGKIGGAAPGGRVAVLVGYGPKTTEAKRRPRKSGHAPEPVPAEAHDQFAGTFSTAAPVSRRADDREPLTPQPSQPAGQPLPDPGPAAPEPYLSGGAVLAKPPVRKLAKDLGVDLTRVPGSGPGGVITREDVQQAASPEPTTPSPVPTTPGPTESPCSLSKGGSPIPVTPGSRSRVSARPPPRPWSARRSPRRT